MTRSRTPPVQVAWRGVRAWMPTRGLVRAARAALDFGKRGDLRLSIVCVGDAELARLHAHWLADPSPTDVITFDLSDEVDGALGELYVSAPCARRTGRQRDSDPQRELALYIVHGCLHLCGFDDRSARERAAMRAAESSVLEHLGYARDAAPHDLVETVRASAARRRRAK